MDPIWRRIERTLRRRLPTGQCASIVGDLAEEYAARRQVGRLRAALWLRREARSITRAYQIDAGALESPRIAQPLDLRIALRAMARRPGLAASRFATVTVVVTAVSAVFTVASASFLRPLPFPDAKRLLLVYAQPPGTTSFASRTPLHPMSFSRLQTAVQAFDRFEGQWAAERAIGGEGEPESVQTARVSAGWFDMLGATFTAGRGFSDREVAGNANVAVISHGFWSRRFGGRPGAIGTMVLIDREPHQIIGVIAPGFVSAFVPVEVWSPLNVTAIETQNFTPIRGVARLREGTSLSEAQSELAARFAPVRDELPQVLGGWSLRATGLQEAMFGDRRAGLLALLAAVIVLAVIAAANLANLTLADAIHRRRDFAVRAALGGSRWQISAPDVAQGLVIAVVGGASGLLLASLVVPILIGLDPSGVYTAQQLAADWRVAASGFIVAGLVMIAAVGLPSLRASRSGLADGAGSRTIGAPRATRLRSVLVATQAALTMVLLSAGAVILGTLERSTRTAPGFEVTNVITAQLRLAERTLPDMTSRASFVRNVLERVRHTPGVVDAATTMNLFTSGGSFQTLVHIEHQPTPGGDPHAVQFRRASPGLFRTLGIPLLRGRDFSDADSLTSQPVAVVSRGFAQRFWPGENPIGRRVKRGATTNPWLEVIGEVADIRDIGLDQAPGDIVYVSVYQNNAAAAPVSLVVRTAADPAALLPSIRSAVWSADPLQPLSDVKTLEAFLAGTLGPHRFRATLIGTAGAAGLVLALLGTYAVTSRAIRERRREIGVRLALGGSRIGVCWAMAMITVRGLAAGTLVGAATGLMTDRLISSVLPGTVAPPLLATLGLGLALLSVGALAATVAARAAVSVDPLEALQPD